MAVGGVNGVARFAALSSFFLLVDTVLESEGDQTSICGGASGLITAPFS